MTKWTGRRRISEGLLGVWLAFGGLPAATAAPLNDGLQRQVSTQLKLARTAEQARAPVKAFLHLREALRLEQLGSGNTLGGDSEASREMERFSSALVRRNDEHLMQVLHSRVVPLADKLGLIRLLEEEIILNFPSPESDTLLQRLDE